MLKIQSFEVYLLNPKINSKFECSFIEKDKSNQLCLAEPIVKLYANYGSNKDVVTKYVIRSQFNSEMASSIDLKSPHCKDITFVGTYFMPKESKRLKSRLKLNLIILDFAYSIFAVNINFPKVIEEYSKVHESNIAFKDAFGSIDVFKNEAKNYFDMMIDKNDNSTKRKLDLNLKSDERIKQMLNFYCYVTQKLCENNESFKRRINIYMSTGIGEFQEFLQVNFPEESVKNRNLQTLMKAQCDEKKIGDLFSRIFIFQRALINDFI